jgi:hypothetical protein
LFNGEDQIIYYIESIIWINSMTKNFN